MKIGNSVINSISMIIMAALLAACGKDSPSFGLLPAGQTFKQNKAIFNNQLDILWVVDNSASMSPLQTNLVNNFSSFITGFKSKGYDFHMGVTSTDAYLGEFRGDTRFFSLRDGTDNSLYGQGADTHSGTFTILPTTLNLNTVFTTNATQQASGSGDERAFSSFKDVLSSPLNAGFLRPQSFLAVIILSDEDDFSSKTRVEFGGNDHDYADPSLDTINSYVSYLDTLTATTGAFRRYNVSSIAVIDNACLTAHQAQAGSSIMGTRYMQLTNATNGILGDICGNYSTALDNIQSQIATLSSQFFLDRQPVINSIVVKVNSLAVTNNAINGWTYSSTANSILFHGTAVPAQNATIDITFTPTTIIN